MGNSINGLGDRNPGVLLVLSKSYQHFYDGKTPVVLPYSGRTIPPCSHCFLKYIADAFKGRTVTTPNRSTVPDICYFGNASTNYGDLRADHVNNVTMSFKRDFKIRERSLQTLRGMLRTCWTIPSSRPIRTTAVLEMCRQAVLL